MYSSDLLIFGKMVDSVEGHGKRLMVKRRNIKQTLSF